MINYSFSEYKIDIGNHPNMQKNKQEILDAYNVIINVSDDPAYDVDKNGPKIHWHPINEFGYWTYQPFYWIVHTLNHYIKERCRIYVHCHAGVHRSPMISYLYVRSLGKSPEEAYAMLDEPLALGHSGNWLEAVFQSDVEAGRIPADIVEFMQDVHKHPDKSMMSIMNLRKKLDLPKKNSDLTEDYKKLKEVVKYPEGYRESGKMKQILEDIKEKK